MKIQSKKKFIAFSLVVILATIFSLTWVQGDRASAATIGQRLIAPEAGWERYDQNDSRVSFLPNRGSLYISTSSSNFYGVNAYYFVAADNGGGSIKFKFSGTKLRLINSIYNDRMSDVKIKIDGVEEYYSEYSKTYLSQVLVYEKTGLSNEIHNVEISCVNTFGLDAIDIDSNGYLVTDVSEISFNKTSLSLNVDQTEDLTAIVKPDNASIKDVTWSSSDESIATVDENGKVTAIKAGNAIITAKTTDGSNLTATCDVTVVQPSNDRAILAVTMTNGQTKEYDLPNSEIEAFTNWFDSSNGKGQPKFGFTKKIQPYKEVKEYVVFDKISSYEVRTYTVSN